MSLCRCGLASSEIERDKVLKVATGVSQPIEKENHVKLCVDSLRLSKTLYVGFF